VREVEMSPAAVVLLIGVCSFWVATGVFLALFLKLRCTLTSMEQTLDSVRQEMEKLSPAVSETLHQVASTGSEVEKTVTEARLILSGVREHHGSTMLSGVVAALPVIVSAVKVLKPVFTRKKRDR
jgi:hypothetical protein